jgi:hypothetical protein
VSAEYPAYASGWSAVAPSEPPAPDPDTRGDLRVAGVVVAVLAGLGAVLGVVWSQWSGPQQRAYVIAPGKLYPYDEVETMAAADGRYLLLVGVVGLLAGPVAWWSRRGNRGPLLAAALGLGGLVGAALTWWVGHLTGGGTYSGRTGSTIAHLPLTLHMHGLLLVEPALAVLGFGLFTAFAAADDLGRPDPVRRRVVPRPGLVEPGRQPQDGGGDGDAARASQQGHLPPQ